MPAVNSSDDIEKLYFTIGEASEQLDLPASLIRFWEKEFEQLKPRKTAKGTRKYSQQDIQLLRVIYQLVKVEGYTLQGAREKLKQKEQLAEKAVLIDKLQQLKSFLENLKNQLD